MADRIMAIARRVYENEVMLNRRKRKPGSFQYKSLGDDDLVARIEYGLDAETRGYLAELYYREHLA